MKKLLITLLLVSPFSFAGWGDVYYCQMTSNSGITLEGERIDYNLEKFTFKLDETKNAMVFGKSGSFKDFVMPMEGFYPPAEEWRASAFISKGHFEKGKFLYADVGSFGATMLSADCDKF
jgi:hypothetical protein